ncbi:hypothetical protein T4A_10430 [Trichinella pseudospiralis]|uniref:Uncharacterized protein n=1 Tax=Trichinella pseudospiralis TaxID=6337 RepID=A0A0V1ESH9_TRIPS|nr:hypothetical protein T4A_10430 [Trichinella pseudospiralis]
MEYFQTFFALTICQCNIKYDNEKCREDEFIAEIGNTNLTFEIVSFNVFLSSMSMSMSIVQNRSDKIISKFLIILTRDF